MKRTFFYTIISLISLLSLSSAVAATAVDRDPWQYNASKLEASLDGKTLEIAYQIQPQSLRSQDLVVLEPLLLAEDGETVLLSLDEPLVFAGSTRYKVLRRRHELHNTNMLEGEQIQFENIVRLNSSDALAPIQKHYRIELPETFRTGKVVMEERYYGCAGCKVVNNRVPLGDVMVRRFGPEDFAFDFREPAAVAVKRYEEAFDSKVNFVVARHELKVNYKNNAQELSSLDAFITKALALKGADLKRVDVAGYASPEGGFAYNKALSERRANSLLSYVKSKHPEISRVPAMHVRGEGEDWKGLRAAVDAAAEMPFRTEILAAIDENTTDVAREAIIRKLDAGRVYKDLLENYYPALRRTTFSMAYEVRPYQDNELAEIFEMNPALMSQQEMFKLAAMYLKEGKDPLPVYRTAYERFRDDPLAAINYGNALLQYKKDGAEAIKVLMPFSETDKRSLFPLAIAYQMQGDQEMAMKYLLKARTAGCKRANAVCKN